MDSSGHSSPVVAGGGGGGGAAAAAASPSTELVKMVRDQEGCDFAFCMFKCFECCLTFDVVLDYRVYLWFRRSLATR